MDNYNKDNCTGNQKSISSFILKAFAVVICIVIIGIAGFYALLYWSVSGTQVTNFNKEKIVQMESLFGFTVTDDIKLERYSENEGWDDDRVLSLNTNDYKKFMNNNITGTIENYEEYDDRGNLVAHFQYIKENKCKVGVCVYQFFENDDYMIELFIS